MIHFENKEAITLSNRVSLTDIFNIRGILKTELKNILKYEEAYKIRFTFAGCQWGVEKSAWEHSFHIKK